DGPADGDVAGGVPERGVRYRCVPAQDFLDRVRDQGRVGGQCVALAGVGQQGDCCVADQAGGGVVPGDDQLEDGGEHLLFGQRAVVVGGAYQVGDQVLARGGAFAGEQPGQVPDDVRRGRYGLGRRFGRR